MQIIHPQKNNLIKKMGKEHEKTFLQRKPTDGQQIYEMILYITNYQGNADQNHDNKPLYTNHECYQKVNK